jgi:glycosyltransferase involved in cell wall biosynthesis
MRVILYSADSSGCQFVRCREPLRTSGVDGEIRQSVSMIGRGIRRRRGAAILSEEIVERVVAPVDADVVVFQRPPHRDTPALIEQFQAQGVAVVVDVDDDLMTVHPQNAAYALHAGLLSPEVNARYTAKCCGIADLVTVSTPALAERYGAHGRVAVLRNCVPAAMLDMPCLSDGHTVGWAGRVATHPGDLEVARGGVGEALGGDWRFEVIGSAEGVRERLGLAVEPDELPWVESVEDYHMALGRLTVGICPLGDTKFNASKSWLKPIEMAARGVPFVASPRDEYRALGLGILAPDRSRNWRRAVTDLMRDEGLRVEMAEYGREVVRAHHTFEGNGHLWRTAWEQALANRRSSSRMGRSNPSKEAA